MVTPEGLVSAASFSADPDRGPVIVPGRLFSLFGERLAESSLAATTTPLPTVLAGVSVTVDGLAAPLLYVSPGQINLQVPFSVTSAMPEIVVSTPQGASDPISVSLAYDAPGLFAQDSGGCGQGAILNVAPDGSVTVNAPTQSAVPGDFISVFATGFGPVSFPPPAGSQASASPLSIAQNIPFAQLGSEANRLSYRCSSPASLRGW